MRNTLKIFGMMAAMGMITACDMLPPTTPISAESAEMERVTAALANWPKAAPGGAALKRPFFATIHLPGHRTTASGIMQYYGPRDFRLTAVTEMGAILFDGRVNWAGVTILRQLDGVDKSVIEMLLRDISRAFELPLKVEGLKLAKDRIYLRQTMADTHQYTWIFDAGTGLLKSSDIEVGGVDSVHVDFMAYNAVGWPEDIRVVRKSGPFEIFNVRFTFTDENVVQGNVGGNAQ